ncbi:hypothetical protein GQ54DRAFT_100174 [Martensiomyces pterosporus]|nr:hypothetical protein GQ54DRAFT_100174 [Martensiomyces pterosporus]
MPRSSARRLPPLAHPRSAAPLRALVQGQCLGRPVHRLLLMHHWLRRSPRRMQGTCLLCVAAQGLSQVFWGCLHLWTARGLVPRATAVSSLQLFWRSAPSLQLLLRASTACL